MNSGSVPVRRLYGIFQALCALSLWIGPLGLAPAAAQPTPSARATPHPWVVGAPRHETEAYFTNMPDGKEVQSPFVVKFGLSEWGIAPAQHDVAATGHHHLLIDKPLPIPPNKPIPFDQNHVHFGKGQMETVLDLPPGKHTLRLLLANHAHVPFFIYSPERTVAVEPGRSDLPADYGKKPRVEILDLKTGDSVKAPFRINFHASGLNVANAAAKVPGTGYFQLRVRPSAGGREEVIAFADGATETWLNPPTGAYRLQLDFVGDARSPQASSAPVEIVVARP